MFASGAVAGTGAAVYCVAGCGGAVLGVGRCDLNSKLSELFGISPA